MCKKSEMNSKRKTGLVEKKILQGIIVLVLILIALPANATIIGGNVTGGTALSAGGTFQKLGVPLGNPFGPVNSVGNDTFQSPNLFGFDEDQNIVIGASLAANEGSNLVAGDTVASHYVFFDPGPGLSMTGTVDFDSTILAIMTMTGNLLASDFLANTGVNYLNPVLRGLEVRDFVTISGLQQIEFNVFASTPGDYVRVLTAFSPGGVVQPPGPPGVIPEPATIALLGIGLVGLAGAEVRRRRKKKAVDKS